MKLESQEGGARHGLAAVGNWNPEFTKSVVEKIDTMIIDLPEEEREKGYEAIIKNDCKRIIEVGKTVQLRKAR